MKTVIMAGGKGERLRPLTCTLPKPLQPLLGRPILYYIFDLLVSHGIDAATLTLGYLADRVTAAAREETRLRLSFTYEETPMGTAGGVLLAAGRTDETVLVMSGDALCDFDLTAAIRYHEENKNDVTILTKEVADPREYGLCATDGEGRVHSFLEKPSFESCLCSQANTGIYLLSPRAMAAIPADRPCDFAGDVFPKLLKEGARLFTLPQTGYWCDIGDLGAYLRCQQDMLKGRVRFDKTRLPGSFTPEGYRGQNVRIGFGSEVKNCILGDGVRIGANCRLEEAVLWDGVWVGDSVILNRAAAATGARIGTGTTVSGASGLGQDCRIGEGAQLLGGIRVYPGRTVAAGECPQEDVCLSDAAPLRLTEQGLSGRFGEEITPSLCLKLGTALQTAAEALGGAVAVGCSGEPEARCLLHGVLAGTTAAGAELSLLEEGTLPEFRFAMGRYGAKMGLYLAGGDPVTVHLWEEGGLPLSRQTERRMESVLNRGISTVPDKVGRVIPRPGLREDYLSALTALCGTSLEGYHFRVEGPKALETILTEALTRAGGRVDGSGITVTLTRQGALAALSEETGASLSGTGATIACCLRQFRKGEDVAVPMWAPGVLEELAAAYGCRVLRYAGCPVGKPDEARELAVTMPFLRDGLQMAMMICGMLAAEKMTLQALTGILPRVETAVRTLPISVQPGFLLRRLTGEDTALTEGAILRHRGRQAYVRPGKSGKDLHLYTEATGTETAAELCDWFARWIDETQRQT